ncbi:signal peptidase [Flavobacterium franklandianum]|uniref:Signal peptidase n=1 Tax=Flavobacterium franklandianum TaxID=2594430 RepID=A0A553CJC2_9FLAO|nr:signal peptidase [Flavobacterium franklandianum]TRX20589.1 signal peptidase [Flavobacterium franklandianum]
MKNTVLKYYIAVFYLCSTFVMFGQPGTGSDNGGVDDGGTGDTTPGTPIDDYVWVLAIIAILFVFLKFRAIQKNKIQG